MNFKSMPDFSHKFAIGTKVQAVWSEDGEWYDATIDALTPKDYLVHYDGWGNKEKVDSANVSPIQQGTVNPLLEVEKEVEATKQAIKREIAQAAYVDYQTKSLPDKLQIEPNDTEDVFKLGQPNPDDLGFVDSVSVEEIGGARTLQLKPKSAMIEARKVQFQMRRVRGSGKLILPDVRGGVCSSFGYR